MNLIIQDRDIVKSRTTLMIVLTTLILSILLFWNSIVGIELIVSVDRLSDLLRANVPTYTMLFDELAGGNFSLWSWKMGLGTTFFSHADVFFDPFTYITMCAGRDNIAYMICWALIAKIICEGIAFSIYLRQYGFNEKIILIASILYAFSGYSLIMGSNLALGTVLVYFPLLLLATDNYVKEGKKLFLTIMFVLIGLYSYYYFYITGIAVGVYFLIRCYNQKINVIKKLLVFIGCAVLAILLISPILLPQLEMGLSSTRSNGGKDVVMSFLLLLPDPDSLSRMLLRSFNLNILGTSDEYSGDYFQSELFIACFPVLLFIYNFMKNDNGSKRLNVYFLLLLLASSLPIVAYAMNAFSTINRRWLFVVHTFLCVSCAIILNNIYDEGFDHKKLAQSSCISLLLILVILAMLNKYNVHFNFVVLSAVVLLLAVPIIVYLLEDVPKIKHLHRSKNCASRQNFFVGIVFCIILFSILINFMPWLNGNASHNYEGSYGYDDSSVSVIEQIQSEDTSFYRIYKDYDSVYDGNNIPSDNDAMVQSYYGLKNYNSMNNPNYIQFLQTLGVYVACYPDVPYLKEQGINPCELTGATLNYINGIDDNYQLLDYLGVKYYLSKADSDNDVPTQFIFLYSMNGVDVYLNTNYYNLAFVNSDYLSYDEFMTYDYQDRTNLLMTKTILSEGADEVEGSTNPSYCTLTYFSESSLSFDVNIVDGPQYVSFSMPYDSDWKIYVDGENVESTVVNISLLGVKLSEGQHEVKLIYKNGAFNSGLKICGITVIACFVGYLMLNVAIPSIRNKSD